MQSKILFLKSMVIIYVNFQCNLTFGHSANSIEDDFITWKEGFWPAVCEHYGIETMGEDVSVRQYKLTEHTEINPDRLYTGEVARLHSFVNQRP